MTSPSDDTPPSGDTGHPEGTGHPEDTGHPDDTALARHALENFGEMLSVVARWGVGPHAVVRRTDAVGARMTHVGQSPWYDAAVVPLGATPPADDPSLPYCLWTTADRADGRIEDTSIAMPCMGLLLDRHRPDPGIRSVTVETPSLEEVGGMNDRAYGTDGLLRPMAARIRDERVTAHGVRVDGRFVCTAMTLPLGDDLGIHYVATESDHRRRGLATALLTAVLDAAAAEGMRSATLQASPDGRPVYLRMGFHQVELLHAMVRPPAPPAE
jgi:GNAT superfamily N-acetyltransferase